MHINKKEYTHNIIQCIIYHAYKQERIYSQYFSPFDNIKKGTNELRERKLPLSISIGEYKT